MTNLFGATGKPDGWCRWLFLLILLVAGTAAGTGCAVDEGPPPVEPSVFSMEWERTFGGPGRNCGYCVQQTKDEGFIIAGQAASLEAGGGELYLVKVDEAGNMEWEQSYGGPQRASGYYAQQTSDGGYIAAGQITPEGGSGSDAYLVKVGKSGEIQWERSFGGEGNESALFVSSAGDGGYIATGWTESFHNRRELYLIKVDAKGRKQWEASFCQGSRSTGSYVLEAEEGGFLAAGWMESSGTSGSGERDIYLVKVDSGGNLEWEQVLGGTGDEVGFFVQPDKEGGYVAAGQCFSYASGTTSVYLAKVDLEGHKKWEKNIDSNESYLGLSVHPSLDGGCLILGQVMDPDGYRGISLAKADQGGKKQWVIYLGGGKNSAALSAVQADDESYVVVGWTETEGNGDRGVYLAKIKP